MVLLFLLSCDNETTTSSTDSGRVFRLNHRQWENTVSDLLGLDGDSGYPQNFVPDPAFSTFDTDPTTLVVSPVLWQQYQIAAEGLAERVVTEQDLYDTVVPAHLHSDAWQYSRGVRDRWIADFGERAFRRPLRPDERTQLADIFELGDDIFDSGEPFVDGVQATVTAVLQSPAFLYRTEGMYRDGGELSSFELASRLSYALWNSAPDDELLIAAKVGLDSDDALLEQVERMLDDPRGHEMISDIHRQLLHIDAYEQIWRPSDLVLDIDVYQYSMPAAMQQEVYTFVDDVIYNGGTVRELLTSSRTFANTDIAEIYGVEVDSDEALVEIELDPDERAGLLTMSGFLAVSADESAPNLIKRGAFINEAFLCADVPPAPAFASELPEDEGEEMTLRERIENHTGSCGGSCHNDFINPIAFAYGNYNEDGGFAPGAGLGMIDATGSYPFDDGTWSFDGVVDLAWLMAEREQVHRCYVGRLAGYLHGMAVDDLEPLLVQQLTEDSLADRGIRDMLVDIIMDPSFRYTRL